MPGTPIGRHRELLGALGERAAAGFLERNGARIVGRNVAAGRGEIDLLATDADGPFVVEVKSGMASENHHPRWNFTDRKAERVLRAARLVGIRRVDLVTVVFGPDGLDIEWHRRVA